MEVSWKENKMVEKELMRWSGKIVVRSSGKEKSEMVVGDSIQPSIKSPY